MRSDPDNMLARLVVLAGAWLGLGMYMGAMMF